jgi:DNA-directed RNA polymerase subunit alpha
VTTAEVIDVRHFLREDDTIGTGNIEKLEEVVGGSQLSEVRQELREMQSEIEAGNDSQSLLLRSGIAAYVLGQHKTAVESLSRVSESATGAFYHALAVVALGRYEEAEGKFQEAAKIGYDKVECVLHQAGAIRMSGRVDEAESLIRSVATEAASRAEYSYQMGCIFSDQGDTYSAIEYFERAVDMDGHHSQALFRLAAENANRGNDDEAVRLYEQSLSKPPYHPGAMINLGLLYEDAENFRSAAYCFRRVLESDPNHERANLYLKDIESTSEMYYDEESARDENRLAQLLSRPVTDFELSVRSRNCLESMNIFTLGDLTRVTEQELLSGKNFGETSLYEIRDLVQSHGLTIGQNLNEAKSQDYFFRQQELTPQEQSAINRPISELNLSVRSRKCMSRLGMTTIGELLQRSADELLSSRNFGVTSLNEIRSKLTEQDLKLRND